MIPGFIFLVLRHLGLLSIIIFPKYWPINFSFILPTLIFADLFYFVYLTLFYKTAKSKDGFTQTKRFIMGKEKIYSVIKKADLILSKLANYIIPIFILCICAIFVDSVYFFVSMGYESLGIGIIVMLIFIILPFIYFWRYSIKTIFRFLSKD